MPEKISGCSAFLGLARKTIKRGDDGRVSIEGVRSGGSRRLFGRGRVGHAHQGAGQQDQQARDGHQGQDLELVVAARGHPAAEIAGADVDVDDRVESSAAESDFDVLDPLGRPAPVSPEPAAGGPG